MELEEFIEKFAEQFDDTDVSDILPDTYFQELEEWSSLIALSVILMVDEEYGITIEGKDIENVGTIEELFNTIESKK